MECDCFSIIQYLKKKLYETNVVFPMSCECGSQYGSLTFNTWLPRTASSTILTDFQCEHTFCQVLIPEISH